MTRPSRVWRSAAWITLPLILACVAGYGVYQQRILTYKDQPREMFADGVRVTVTEMDFSLDPPRMGVGIFNESDKAFRIDQMSLIQVFMHQGEYLNEKGKHAGLSPKNMGQGMVHVPPRESVVIWLLVGPKSAADLVDRLTSQADRSSGRCTLIYYAKGGTMGAQFPIDFELSGRTQLLLPTPKE
jgi:hypothetical protein